MDPYAQSFFHPITPLENFRVPRLESEIARLTPIFSSAEDYEMTKTSAFQMDTSVNEGMLDATSLEKQEEGMDLFALQPEGNSNPYCTPVQTHFYIPGPGQESCVRPQAVYSRPMRQEAAFLPMDFHRQADVTHSFYMQTTQHDQVQVEPQNWQEGRLRRRGAVAAVDVSQLFPKIVSEARFYRNVEGMGRGRVFCFSKPKQDFSKRKRPRPYPHVSVLLEWRRSIYSKA